MKTLTAATQVLAAALLAAASLATYAAPKQWTVTQLSSGDFGGSARSVNNRGDVAGTNIPFDGYPRPTVWINGMPTDLLGENPTYGVANAINDQGVVAATSRSGVIAWKDGVTTPLQIAGEPADINRKGHVVGIFYPWGEIAWGPARPFLWKDGVVHDLGSLGNNYAAAAGINDRGVVVGGGTLPMSSTMRGFVWQDGAMRQLGTLGGEHSGAVDVNNRGVILGTADDANGINHMVAWDLNGGLLHDYGPRLAGHALNDHGDIVGNQLDTGRPFLLKDGAYTWLLDLPAMREQGWVSFAAFDINDHGVIVGIGWKPGVPNSGVPLLLKPR
ncbi:MAG TPA: hypothetical protein VEC19_18450 [Usitatibacter sp.]|nr:hypothetical protein [Usitatibacter sp.]